MKVDTEDCPLGFDKKDCPGCNFYKDGVCTVEEVIKANKKDPDNYSLGYVDK